jgi:hypothetical protein
MSSAGAFASTQFRVYLSRVSLTVVLLNCAFSCFVAVQKASAAMKQANPAADKEYGGGSIILTASVAGVRSGAGPIDCEQTILPSVAGV